MNKNFIEAIATLVGITIGAGILGIPYVISKSGFLIGIIHLLLIGIIIMILHLYLGEISLRTKEKHHLAGYTELYLGKKAKQLMAVVFIIGVYGALTAYLLGEGQALASIFGKTNPLPFTLISFFFAAFIIYNGLNILKRTELILMIVMFFLLITLLLSSSKSVNITYLQTIDLQHLFTPYGVILFAFLGASAIPEMKEELRKQRFLLKKAIILGSLIPIMIYLIFAFLVVSVTGQSTTEIATIGLGITLGKTMVVLGNLFAMFTMTAAFIGLGLSLKWMYHYDYHINNTTSFLLVCAIPLALVLWKITTFITLLKFTGTLVGGIEGILIVLMYRKAKIQGKRKPEYELKFPRIVDYGMITLFLLGIFYLLLTL